MECGAQEYVCLAATWLSENENLASYVTELLGHLSAGSNGAFKIVGQILEKHGQAIVGLLGISFGVYKWWRYREHILHKRLKEYLEESDKRLREGEHYVLDALRRPGPAYPITVPLFANTSLRSVLRERNWDRTTLAFNVETSCDGQLMDAIQSIQRKIETAENQIKSLKQQYATAHILRGAIAASVAERAPDKATERNNLALTSFRTALQMKGHQADIVAKELEAHQLRKMGYLYEAIAAYEELEELAQGLEGEREQNVLLARAKRYRAEALQASVTFTDEDGKLCFEKSGVANSLLSWRIPASALALREAYKPFAGWDLLEQGETAFVAAFISHICEFRKLEGEHLDEAETAYSGLLASLPRKRTWRKPRSWRLKAEAKKGLERVARARQGDYDTSWLVLPSKQVEHDA